MNCIHSVPNQFEVSLFQLHVGSSSLGFQLGSIWTRIARCHIDNILQTWSFRVGGTIRGMTTKTGIVLKYYCSVAVFVIPWHVVPHYEQRSIVGNCFSGRSLSKSSRYMYSVHNPRTIVLGHDIHCANLICSISIRSSSKRVEAGAHCPRKANIPAGGLNICLGDGTILKPKAPLEGPQVKKALKAKIREA